MSDFYLCEHKERCCGTCLRALKTERNQFESSLTQVREEMARYYDGLAKAQAERDRYRSLLEMCKRHIEDKAERFSEREKEPLLFQIKEALRGAGERDEF